MVVAAVLIQVIGAACTGGGGAVDQPPGQLPPIGQGVPTLGAEQWPQCLNPLTSCSEDRWAHYTVLQPVLPKLMWIDRRGNVVASPLLSEAPTLQNGGLTTNPFTITYQLNPKAGWDDGTPITSSDVEFTWKAILHTKGSIRRSGYRLIQSIDASDPRIARIVFKAPYADWYDLMGGAGVNGYVLKKAAFPKADPEKPNLLHDMNVSFPFSGGPWKLVSWTKNQEVLVRNPRYWGHHPLLDQVTFVPQEEHPRDVEALLKGQVDALFRWAGPDNVTSELKSPNVQVVAGSTNYANAFWFNFRYGVFRDPKVREAFAYAVDRQAIIDQIVRRTYPHAQVLNCPPPLYVSIDSWCNGEIESELGRYTYDPAMSISILESDGYECSKVPAHPCTRYGHRLRVASFSPQGIHDREISLLMQNRIKAAGFEFVLAVMEGTPISVSPAHVPRNPFEMGEFTTGGTVDPSPTQFSYLCDQIPTKATRQMGANTIGYCNPQLDAIMREADQEVDPARRHQLITHVFTQLDRDLVVLPLFTQAVITAWRRDKLGGPIGKWNSSPYGVFWNMDYWYLVTA